MTDTVHPKNKERADRAEAALLAYAALTNQLDSGDWEHEKELVVSDLLSDLQHFCKQHDICFANAIDRGTSHYTVESNMSVNHMSKGVAIGTEE